ncbi:NAD(P)-dependent oxidoreductase [Sinorhizobium medicae]|uniref:NAD(P)-dependent oxidoreductase n=1 Tax=Sinorhizobium medicae TaxID=110321 RepID=UPI003C718AD0
MSRAAVVDFPAMLEAAGFGHIRVATDVFPEEPVAPDDPVRTTPGLLLSAHRTGGTRDAFYALPPVCFCPLTGPAARATRFMLSARWRSPMRNSS